MLQPRPPGPSVSERRGRQVPPLQTNFNRPVAVARPPAPNNNRPRPSTHGDLLDKVPLQAKRQSSRSSLRNLFARDKPARKPPHGQKLAEIEENSDSNSNSNSNSNHPPTLSPSVCATPKTEATLVTSPTPTASEPPAQNKHLLSKPLVPGRVDEKPSVRDMGWKPPPLFQAYPQAIKHGTLPAPMLSADAILRVHAMTTKGGNEENMTGLSQQKGPSPEAHAARRKEGNKEKKHLRSVSETIGKTEWTQKIYILTTSGYILQYAGDGKFDRLPDKMMLLGPRSVAFASDAIPGKHWVLQVSQGSGADGTTATDAPRPLLARLGFHRSYTRRLTQSFLLVFTDPDELSSWLLAVRSKIEARGGKKYVSERVFDDEMEHQLRPKPSVRQLVKKDPNRFSNSFLLPQLEGQTEVDAQSVQALSRQSSYASNNRRSVISTAHTDVTSPATSNIGTSGGGRFYTAAMGPREVPSSSVLPTPPRDATQSPVSSPKKRQSMRYMSLQPPADPQTETSAPYREPLVRSTSPPAPNFSVPSFSKRFAARSGMTQIPPLQLGQIQSNRVDEEKFEANTIGSFPSPPQSPNQTLSSMGRNDPSDPYLLASHQSSSVRRPLRVVNSQDSLVASEQATQYSRDRKPITRPPRGSVSTAGSATRPSRPISTISGNVSLSSDAQLPQSPSTPSSSNHPGGGGDPRPRRDAQRSRTSVLYPTNNSNVTYSPMPNVSRRKSTPGLNIGPPVMPPPNCPLPKVPSPGPAIPDVPAVSPPSCSSPPSHPPRGPRERKMSTTTNSSASSHPRFSLGMRSVSSRHANMI